MNIYIQSQHLSFKARPGAKVLKKVSKEYQGNKSKIDKFKHLFEVAHNKYTNKNTIIDIDNKGNLIYSHISFPNIKYCYKTEKVNSLPLSKRMINECSKTIATGESEFFHHVILQLLKKGVSIPELRIKANDEQLGKTFNNLLFVLEKILKDNPKSKLTKLEFNLMQMKINDEKIRNTKGNIIDIINELKK